MCGKYRITAARKGYGIKPMPFTQREKILLNVEKPTRYTGGELNMCIKDPKQVEVRFGFCFPDVYEIAMSHCSSRSTVTR
mgnify:CR=1 FL=1